MKASRMVRGYGRHHGCIIETLRRRVTGRVDMDCRPGPSTVLTKSEEDEIVRYLIQMADMGYGLTREAVMHISGVCIRREMPEKSSFQK